MKKLYKAIQHVFLLIIFCFFIIACSKLTQNNFDKIKNNMSMKQVIAILGEPTSSESINIAGISGTSAVWRDSNAEIDIQFLNDKVIVKAFNSADDAKALDVKSKKVKNSEIGVERVD